MGSILTDSFGRATGTQLYGVESSLCARGTDRFAAQPPENPRLPNTAPLRLVCSEVWGGNRPIDREIELPGLVGRAYSRPCGGRRGGDVHYLSVCDSGLVCQMLVADVVGHGEAVAGVSSTVHSLLRRYLNRLDPRHVLKKLNRRLNRAGVDGFTTAVAVNYFPPWRRLSLSYAGHPRALLYRAATGRWSSIDAANRYRNGHRWVNLPLAVDSRTVFTRRTVKVEFGDRLLVLTDGVLEAPDRDGKLLGHGRLKKLLQQKARCEPGEIVNAVVELLMNRAGNDSLSHDDVTLLMVEFVPGPPGPALWHAIKNRLLGPGRARQNVLARGADDSTH